MKFELAFPYFAEKESLTLCIVIDSDSMAMLALFPIFDTFFYPMNSTSNMTDRCAKTTECGSFSVKLWVGLLVG